MMNGAMYEKEIDFTPRSIFCSAPGCRTQLARCTSQEHYAECESLRYCVDHEHLGEFVFNSVRMAEVVL